MDTPPPLAKAKVIVGRFTLNLLLATAQRTTARQDQESNEQASNITTLQHYNITTLQQHNNITI